MTELVINVRSLTGTFHGVGDHGVSEWPPSPFRLFQALRSGVGSVPDDSPMLHVLQWLESLGPPIIEAPVGQALVPYTLFVPNNDIDAVNGDARRVGELRVAKVVRPQRFGRDATLRYRWQAITTPVPAGLDDVVHRLHTFGLGVDAAFAECCVDECPQPTVSHGSIRVWTPADKGAAGPDLPVAVPGSLARLEQRHAAWRGRLRQDGTGVLFSQPPGALPVPQRYANEPSRLVFALRSTDPARSDRFEPWPVTSVDQLIGAVAAEILSSFPDEGDWLAMLVLGRGAGPRELEQRLRIIALPSRGHTHADGQVRSVLIEVPQGSRLQIGGVAWALDGSVIGEAVLSLESESAGSVLHRLGYARSATSWRTVTPVVLPNRRRRGEKLGGLARQSIENAAAARLIDAARHAGLPRPTAVMLQREPFGSSSRMAHEYAGGSRFELGRLFHAEMRFDAPVTGPVLAGDGRFRGLGLFEAVGHGEQDAWCFAIDPAVPAIARVALLRQFRRAVMARAQGAAGKHAKLSSLFHGHDSTGGAARSGRHEHLYYRHLVQDDRIHAIEVLAPIAVNRTAEPIDARNRAILVRALTGFDELRFERRLLRLSDVAPIAPIPTKRFQSTTRYVSTRRTRRQDDREAFLRRDVLDQLGHLGLPPASDVLIDAVSIRPDGLLEADVCVLFERCVIGPILIGRDAHFGGGDLVARPE